jgi:hypothetical protein
MPDLHQYSVQEAFNTILSNLGVSMPDLHYYSVQEACNLLISTIGSGGSGAVLAHGSATLNGSGTITVSNANVTTADKIILARQSGNSNQAIYVSAVVNGVSFTITSAGGVDDASLVVGWMILS